MYNAEDSHPLKSGFLTLFPARHLHLHFSYYLYQSQLSTQAIHRKTMHFILSNCRQHHMFTAHFCHLSIFFFRQWISSKYILLLSCCCVKNYLCFAQHKIKSQLQLLLTDFIIKAPACLAAL